MNSEHPDNDWPTVNIDADIVHSEEADVTVEVVNQYSDNKPAKIRIEFTNLLEERMIRFEATPPFSDPTTENQDGNRLYLIADERNGIDINSPKPLIPDEPIDGCWQKPEGGLIEALGQPIVTLKSGRSISRIYSLLDGRNDVCLPPGTYRFEEEDYFEDGEQFGFDVILD